MYVYITAQIHTYAHIYTCIYTHIHTYVYGFNREVQASIYLFESNQP